MLGDAIIAVTRWTRQHLLCVHHYHSRSTPAGAFSFTECCRCHRTKDWERHY